MQEPRNNKENEAGNDTLEESSQVPEEEILQRQPQEDKRPIGNNELRIVKGIEESISGRRGPHVHVIKSREYANAYSFSAKVTRVLAMHGYKIVNIDRAGLENPIPVTNSQKVTIYTINENTIKEFLGENLNTVSAPMEYLYNNSSLASVKDITLITTVTDAFYDRIGLQNFNESVEQTLKSEKDSLSRKSATTRETGTAVAFYLIGISLLFSAMSNLVGYDATVNYAGFTFDYLFLIGIIISFCGVAVRAFTFGSESNSSKAMVLTGIGIFLALFLIGEISINYHLKYTNVLTWTEGAIQAAHADYILAFLAAAVFVLSLAKYTLFLGRRGKVYPYALSIGGLSLIAFATLFWSPAGVAIFPSTALQSALLRLAYVPFSYSPYTPVFGAGGYFYVNGTPQYMIYANYIPFAGNLMIAASFFTSAKRGLVPVDHFKDKHGLNSA